MLYFIESGIFAKIGYSNNADTFKKRIETYRTHNPAFKLIDTVEYGTLEDERMIRKQYSKYLVDGNREWSYAKKLLKDIWVKYRVDKEKNVDYYSEFGIFDPYEKSQRYFGYMVGNKNQLEAMKKDYIEEDEVDLYKEFKKYYEKNE